ncbi:MAG: LysM peptidoglycan-binding domain-containing protein [Planctomycetes bacterium]|nr:LysM peptidoglycan-binding domain-containing protein [Planctomycetota bacterium]
MTRSRISMIVAAAGLVLVGLLAAALFTPSKDEPTEDQNTDAAKSEKAEPVQMTSVLDYKLDVPPIEAPTPTPEVKPEPKKEDAPAPTPKSEGGVIEYKIQPGDMISKLAVKYGCSSEDIYKLNDGLSKETASKLRVGQTIKIPTGEKGAEAVANAGKSEPKPTGDYYPKRVVVAEPGDTAFSLAIEYYGARNLFRKIIDANPELTWSDRLKGGEQVMLPEHGDAPSTASSDKPSGETVERSSLIPPRK